MDYTSQRHSPVVLPSPTLLSHSSERRPRRKSSDGLSWRIPAVVPYHPLVDSRCQIRTSDSSQSPRRELFTPQTHADCFPIFNRSASPALSALLIGRRHKILGLSRRRPSGSISPSPFQGYFFASEFPLPLSVDLF